MQIFLSYARGSDDDPAAHVRLLEQRLVEEGYSVFLDFHIQGGENWSDALQRQLRICAALISIYTDRANRTRWVFAEAISAIVLRRPILIVAPDGAQLPPPLDVNQALRGPADSPDVAHLVIGFLQRRGIRPARFEAETCPYPGLRALDGFWAGVFFGRESEIEEILGLIRVAAKAPHGRFILISGSSGVGKSSLLGAGLLPRLQEDLVLQESHRICDLRSSLHDLVEGVLDLPADPQRRAIVILDQLENLFDAIRTEVDDRPFALLARLVESGALVVGGVRSNARHPMSTHLARHRVPCSIAEIHRLPYSPARKANRSWSFGGRTGQRNGAFPSASPALPPRRRMVGAFCCAAVMTCCSSTTRAEASVRASSIRGKCRRCPPMAGGSLLPQAKICSFMISKPAASSRKSRPP